MMSHIWKASDSNILYGSNCLNNVTFTFCLDSLGLHRVRNPSNVKGAVSLHLYSPPITKCQRFDDKNGDAETVPAKFYSVNGKRCECSK